ncbi:MAG: gamma carbonic anhydrase family protein [SAR202 cluster bacterium]|nr:gamma carbonic anhydrase family protein [SAR202 cluster bacterium]
MLRSLEGKSPRVHPTAFVSETAYLIGDVEIGEGSSVWPGTVIRADMGKITIGKFTCIQDNSVVHGDADVLIGDMVVIGHRVLCHAARVGDRTLIGSGSTVNDGVVIGADSLIASGAMVIERMDIPARSMVVGIPARVKSQVEDRHMELIRHTCESYIEKTKRYKKQGNLE